MVALSHGRVLKGQRVLVVALGGQRSARQNLIQALGWSVCISKYVYLVCGFNPSETMVYG